MATGSRYSVSLSSDQVFDRNCSVCEEDNTTSEAVCYCAVCCKYFCLQCQRFHNKLHRDHQDNMLDKTAMLKTLPKPTTRDTLTTICEEHGKLVDIYCRDHDVVCCTVCVAIRHTKCDHANYIPKIAGGFSEDAAVAKLRSDLQAVRADMTAVKSSRKDDQTRLKKEKEHVLTQVKDSRRRMNEVFDRLEEEVVRGADTRYEALDDSIQRDLEECDEALRKIEKIIQELERADTSNDSQLFVHVKQGVKRVGAWREVINQIKQHVGGGTIKFVLNENIERYLQNLRKLGEFAGEIRKPSKPHLVDRKENVMVKRKKDNYTCNIWGSCCLPGGGALLSDNWNNQLKRLNSSYQVTDSCPIKDPGGVCYIEQSGEAAVCVNRSIKIVSLGAKMSVTRVMNMNNVDCYGVASSNNLLYVTEDGGSKLHVVDYAKRRLVVTVDTDNHGRKLFSRTQQVAVNSDGSQIWVADLDRGFVALDKGYDLLRVVKVDGIGGARGVCVDKQNAVFVCCEDPNAVLQLTSDGENSVLQPDDLSEFPLSVCYDDNRSRLLVTMFNTDSIKVVYVK